MPARKPRWTYDAASGRYRARSGRFLPSSVIRRQVDRAIRIANDDIAALTTDLRERRISLKAWEQGMRDQIRIIHTLNAEAAKGGREQMTPADWGRTGQLVRRQYAFLEQRAAKIENGQQPVDGRLTRTARSYMEAGRSTYHQVERSEQLSKGYDEERNIIMPGDSCGSCLSETARGWVPIGALLPIGARTCHGNCRCYFSYRRAAA